MIKDDFSELDGRLVSAVRNTSLHDMITSMPTIYNNLPSSLSREQLKGLCIAHGEELGGNAPRILIEYFRILERTIKEKEKENRRKQICDQAEESFLSLLSRDDKGNVIPTIDNFRTIMEFDSFYDSIRFNLLRNVPEKITVDLGKTSAAPWTDTDEARSMAHIESEYKIYDKSKHLQALLQLFEDRSRNPVQEIVDSIEWDGSERIGSFLHRWMHCEDTPYTREVSRLIFAGGINRLYNPGCKFDEVPVLIGTKQGEGKSTLISWLALDDTFKNDVTQFDGQQSIEQLEGAWICEITELLALTKLHDQETAKAFLSRTVDKYRKPWAHNVGEYPRRCIFIGTTNNRRFLKDKTGNRRFYPVEVFSSAKDLYDHEAECREYIRQCWAEAREKYRSGNMPAFADPLLGNEFLAEQSFSKEDDWREGAIIQFLSRFRINEKVCIRQIQREALTMPGDQPHDPSPRDSHEIGEIMDRVDGWVRLKNPVSMGVYGKQRGWKKIADSPASGPVLPF